VSAGCDHHDPVKRVMVCDGCGADLPALSPTMVHPAPVDLWEDDAVYTVCPPQDDNTQPCLELARLGDEMYRRARCVDPDCDGVSCALDPAGT
jgi:hypothetical protein